MKNRAQRILLEIGRLGLAAGFIVAVMSGVLYVYARFGTF